MIRQKAKRTLETAFGEGVSSRDGVNFSVSCPVCDPSKTKKKLSVRLDDYRYHCWVCGIKGKNVWKFISKRKPEINIDPLLFKKSDTSIEENVDNVKEELEVPKGLVPVFRNSREPDVLAVKKYLKKRGFTQSSIARWRVMTSPTGKFRRRVFIPSFDANGKINYYVARAIDETSFKYINAKISKHDMVFNEVDIDWNKPLVLVEGVFDAMKSCENTVPILGSTLPYSSRLFQMLMKNQADVVVSLDPDLKKKSFKIANDLFEAGCNVRVCFTPDGLDMGDLKKEENLRMIALAKSYSPYMSIYHRINEIRSGSVI